MKFSFKLKLNDVYKFKIFERTIEIHPKNKQIKILVYYKETWVIKYIVNTFKISKLG